MRSSIRTTCWCVAFAILLLPFVNRADEPKVIRDEPRPAQSVRDKDKPADDRTPQSIRDKKSPDEPKTEGKGDFTQSAHQLRQGIFLIGGPEVNYIGTAWVISKEHRLLATNAHVADIFSKAPRGKCFAMMNGTHLSYEVVRAWYHPGVRRYPNKDRNLSVRSMDYKVGDVNANCPDVAILQLSENGPPLPVELKLVSPKALFDLQALPAAILGFPGFDTHGWPQPDRNCAATFHTGVISRVTDFQAEGGGKEEFAQKLQYTMETWGGYSGSPIFRADGKVIGLHNSARTEVSSSGTRRDIAQGLRADIVWELLAHHKLGNMVAIQLPPEKIYLQRWLEHDPAWDLYHKLAKLVDEATYLIHTKLDHVGGIAKCDEAIRLFPRYAAAFSERSLGYNNWYFVSGDNWSFEKKVEILTNALEDAETSKKLHGGEDVDTILACIPILNNLGYISKNQKFNRDALKDAEAILRFKAAENWQKASAMSGKAVALSNLNQSEKAHEAHNQALMMNPDSAVLWDNRASYFENSDRGTAARYDKAMGKNLRKKDMLLTESNRKDYKLVSEVKESLTSKDPADNRGCYMKSWSVEMEAGYFYQIDLKSPQFNQSSNYDPILRLYDEKSVFIQEDDDGGGYPHARMFFTPGRTQSFTLTLTSYEPRQTGPYVLTVTRLAKER